MVANENSVGKGKVVLVSVPLASRAGKNRIACRAKEIQLACTPRRM
jgi:hypothetical protein